LWDIYFADTIQKHRYQASIVREKLMMLLDAATKESAPKRDILRHWLQDYVDVNSLGNSHERRPAKLEALTEYEIDAERSINHLAHLLHVALNAGHNENVWNEHDTSLSILLEKRLTRITKIHESEPAFQSTLHLLYTSYELAKSVTDIMEYIYKLSSYVKIPGQLNKEADKASRRLLKEVAAKSTAIKKALGDSGWMSRVLESVGQDQKEQHGQGAETESFVEDFLDVVGEGFREDWAGNVLESWKDSVVGFSYFKATNP
jgi:N-terminal acetyltransferase B complex non-catalytic subunit